MKYISFSGLLFAITFSSFGQINAADSTVQVIGFWDLHEKQNYAVSLEKIKVNGADTTSRELIHYDVEITVKDSASDSYTIEWSYRNYRSDSKNPTVQKIVSISEDMRILIKTDEFGMLQEVVNWREVRDHINASLKKLKKDLADVPGMDAVIQQMASLYSTKAAIESHAILDMHQFYHFHGAKYKLGEVLEGEVKSPNLYGPEPFDCHLNVYLDEINLEDDNYILRSEQIVDSEQLTEATFLYLTNLSKSLGKPGPNKDDISDLTNETLTASRIHVSGWPIYSVLTKTVTAESATNIEERIIEIQ